MKEGLRPFQGHFILKIAIFWVALSFTLNCSGMKPERGPEQKPTPLPHDEKVEQPKKEDPPDLPPAPEPTPTPVPPTASPSALEPPKPPPPSQPVPPPSPPLRTTKIVWDMVNLREGPGLNYKVVGNVKKGTVLSILEERNNWLRVRLEDGKEAWVSKAATSDAPKPTPPAAPKPKPM